MTPPKWTCGKCTMSFHVEERNVTATHHKCPECLMAFDAGQTGGGGQPIRCSIDPSTFEAIRRQAERKLVA